MNNKFISKKVIALLPMKEHSERVPNKNLKLFDGLPLYHIILGSLLDCNFIDQVIINTDGEKIQIDLLKNFNDKRIKIHNRPESIRGDYVSMNEIIKYDLKNSDGEIYLQTHSTNPLLKSNTIQKGVELYLKVLKEKSYDSIFSVTQVQSRFYDKKGLPLNHNPKELIRTQDLPPLFEENSCFYIFSKDSFQNSGNKRIGNSPKMITISPLEAIDIDTQEGFLMAEAIYKLKL